MPIRKIDLSSAYADFPLSIEWRDSAFLSRSPGLHRLVMILRGRALHVTSGRLWQVRAGDVYTIEGSLESDYRKVEDLRLINILFHPDKLPVQPVEIRKLPGFQALFSAGFRGRKPTLRLTSEELRITLCFVETLVREFDLRNAGAEFVAQWFMELAGYMSRAYKHSEDGERGARSSIEKAISHLEAHLNQPMKLEELARLVHMSKRNFSRAFQAATGYSPITYLANLRLIRAAELLRQPDENVTTVAYKVGYNDSNYFARRFHSLFGVSPRDYRKQ